MWLESRDLAAVISMETELAFEAKTGVDTEGHRWYELWPAGMISRHTFAIRITLGWRRLQMAFEPGAFAGDLLADMGRADETGRAAFRAILADCAEQGAEVDMQVNGYPESFDDARIWSGRWRRFNLFMSRGQLELGVNDGEPDSDIVYRWGGRFAAAITAILPLSEIQEDSDPTVEGYPEGAITSIRANRYERDRRNRAAAIAIHGPSCAACGLEFGERYGSVVAGYIEVHHVTPVCDLGPEYVVDPSRDLIPLCPNCHAVAHKRNPPFTVEEIANLLSRKRCTRT